MKKIIKNKKADVPITILVIGVFFICILAIGSFYLFGNRIKRIFIGVDIIEKMNSEIEKYYFYKNLGEFDEEQITNILDIKEDEEGVCPTGKYLYLEKSEGKIYWNKKSEGKRLISVKYCLPE